MGVLKHEIFKKTQVQPNRQKLLNLKQKGKLVTDENIKINALELKQNFKLMMVGIWINTIAGSRRYLNKFNFAEPWNDFNLVLNSNSFIFRLAQQRLTSLQFPDQATYQTSSTTLKTKMWTTFPLKIKKSIWQRSIVVSKTTM